MLTKSQQILMGMAALAGLTAIPAPAGAVTINVDGSNYTTLSAAVAAAYADDNDGPDIINLAVDALPAADGQIFLNKPIVINGDGENGGTGNGIKCDILVDMTGIIAAVNIGPDDRKGYIEIQTAGAVEISNIKIHPNADGLFLSDQLNLVSGIRMFKPEGAADVGDYALTELEVSGSDSSNGNAFVPLDTGADLYNNPAIYKWGGVDAGDGNIAGHASIQLTNAGTGIYNCTIDHCKAGLSYGAALNIPSEGGTVNVFGGVFGHCARDGIRVSGTGVTIKGTPTDRVRIVRNTNIGAANSHSIEMVSGGEILLMEYVDAAAVMTANNFNFRSGHLVVGRFLRGMGKFDDGANETVYINGSNTLVDLVEDSTFVGGGSSFSPLTVTGSVDDPVQFRDTIFTSMNAGVVNNRATTGTVIYTNCAFPTDGVTSETLADPPFAGAGGPQTLTDPSVISPVVQSPQYLLTLEDYDWSDIQGTGDPLNGPGNANVLRPSNVAYLTAGSGGTALTGGAGPVLSGIDPALWMLME